MEYICLKNQSYEHNDFSIVPIRYEDRLDIMKWRNEQIYHLRQSEFLTEKQQDLYFKNVIIPLFQQSKPSQILFSFLKDDRCIGYGGLVHINWIDKNAEISFLMDTSLEENSFEKNWSMFLFLIEKVAFNDLKLHKLNTYAFNIRPHLYDVLEKNHYLNEAILKEQCMFQGKMIDVYIHAKWNKQIILKRASEMETHLTFSWVNNPLIRAFSFNRNKITFDDHKKWFLGKLNDKNCKYFILQRGSHSIGSIRVDFNKTCSEGIVSYLIDPEEHGKGYGSLILKLLEELIITEKTNSSIVLAGLVQIKNKASIRIFEKLNYKSSIESHGILKFQKQLL